MTALLAEEIGNEMNLTMSIRNRLADAAANSTAARLSETIASDLPALTQRDPALGRGTEAG